MPTVARGRPGPDGVRAVTPSGGPGPDAASPYTYVRAQASAGEFHGRSLPDPVRPEVWHLEITAPALVLGSTQRDDVVDRRACDRRGIEVVRRRSGGGAVLLVPGEVVWIDVIVPRGAPGWADDVHVPMIWLGRHLAAAIRVAGDGTVTGRLTVHEGRSLATRWSSLVCFDGVGAGEVLLGGRKLAGISQRRTRHAARLQCAWYTAYDPLSLVELLAGPGRPDPTELGGVATLPSPLTAGVVDALVSALNR